MSHYTSQPLKCYIRGIWVSKQWIMCHSFKVDFVILAIRNSFVECKVELGGMHLASRSNKGEATGEQSTMSPAVWKRWIKVDGFYWRHQYLKWWGSSVFLCYRPTPCIFITTWLFIYWQNLLREMFLLCCNYRGQPVCRYEWMSVFHSNCSATGRLRTWVKCKDGLECSFLEMD